MLQHVYSVIGKEAVTLRNETNVLKQIMSQQVFMPNKTLLIRTWWGSEKKYIQRKLAC